MSDMLELYEAMALHETGRSVFERMFPSRERGLQEQALRLDIATKKRMLGMPLSDDDLENGGSWQHRGMSAMAPRTGSALLSAVPARARLRGPSAMLLGSTERGSLFTRGIANGARAITRRLFG